MKDLSVIITSYHQRELTLNCIKGYLQFCPKELNLKIIIVENSDDISYKDEVLNMGSNIIWVQNNAIYKKASLDKAAWFNANGVEVGMKHVSSVYVFLSHNDVCITSEKFYETMSRKIQEGYSLVGTCYDTHPMRNHSIIILGCLVKSEIVRNVDLYPTPLPHSTKGEKHFECGDRIHLYCKKNDIKFICLKNTHNDKEVGDIIKEPFKSILGVRTINDEGEVIFVHFARGTSKTLGKYNYAKKKGSLNPQEIISFSEKIYEDSI